jgi:hypothetical protein
LLSVTLNAAFIRLASGVEVFDCGFIPIAFLLQLPDLTFESAEKGKGFHDVFIINRQHIISAAVDPKCGIHTQQVHPIDEVMVRLFGSIVYLPNYFGRR